MNFIKQIMAEMKNMIRSKFIIISAIVIFALVTILPPAFEWVISSITGNMGGAYYSYDGYSYYGGYDNKTSLQWDLEWITDSLEYIDQNLDDEALKYAADYGDAMVDFYTKYADLEHLSEENYITQMSYDMVRRLGENYILSIEEDFDEGELKQGMSYFHYFDDFIDMMPDFSEAELQEMYDENAMVLQLYDELAVNNDFSKYVEIQKIYYNDQIESNLSQIEALEASIIENPMNEEDFSLQIENLIEVNESIEEISLPLLDYRVEHNIIIDDGSWQDEAITQIEYTRQNIKRYENPMSEEDFTNDPWLVEEYGTYDKYLADNEEQLQEAQFNLNVAQTSLDNGKPDMKFVHDGARTKTQSSLATTMFISVFGILVGGWAIANEFQSGTIRLLMIRPRIREKVYITRFIAGLKLTYILFFIVFIVNTILNGFIYGFGDYAFPNYTASGEVNYFLMLLGQIFATSTSLVFFYSLSFFASAVFKNMAVAIILPTLCLVGGSILMTFLSGMPLVQALSFTPIPYISMENFFLANSGYLIDNLIRKGMMLSAGLGAAVLLVYSAILFVISLIAFKKQDITN